MVTYTVTHNARRTLETTCDKATNQERAYVFLNKNVIYKHFRLQTQCNTHAQTHTPHTRNKNASYYKYKHI